MKAKEWISLFVGLNGKREGYEKARVTPYMHIMVAHIPKFFELHHSVKIFTGQEVEMFRDKSNVSGTLKNTSGKYAIT